MRRFDHNANQCIDFNEFYEITTGAEHVADKKEEEAKASVQSQKSNSQPMRAAKLQEDVTVTIEEIEPAEDPKEKERK